MKIIPLGSKLLVLPHERKNHKTEGGIEIVQAELLEGEIIEVSDEFSHLYKVGDVVLFSASAGQGEYYNGKNCIWIDGRSTASGGDTWAIISNDEA